MLIESNTVVFVEPLKPNIKVLLALVLYGGCVGTETGYSSAFHLDSILVALSSSLLCSVFNQARQIKL